MTAAPGTPHSASGLEAEPPSALTMFGAQIDRVRAFARDLGERGVLLGLIGPAEPERLWSRHILNCGTLASVVPNGVRVADVGSGAGLPGIVLAAARPDLQVTLIEPMERRVEWLQEQVRRLPLPNVSVVRARAQEVEAGGFDVVTARAVGPLRTLVPTIAPLARRGGQLLLLKGASVDREISAAATQLRKARLVDVRVEFVNPGEASDGTRILRATVQ